MTDLDLDKERAAFKAAMFTIRDQFPDVNADDFYERYAWAIWQARAALAGPGVVVVEKLEWHPHPNGGVQAVAAGLGLYRVHPDGLNWYLNQDHMGYYIGGGTAAAQADFERRILSALAIRAAEAAPEGKEPVAAPKGWKLVPVDPVPEMLGAWYKHKNGFHFADEPPPTDTSDDGAYRAMLLAVPPTEPAQRDGKVATKPRLKADEQRTQCHECGAWVNESDAQWTEDGSPFCKRHKLNAGPQPAPGAERVIGEAEAVVELEPAEAECPFAGTVRYLEAGDRLTVFERDGKLFAQFSDEREG